MNSKFAPSNPSLTQSNQQLTKTAIPPNKTNLAQLSDRASVPQYDRDRVTNGIVHIGVGGFHRAHQALYLDDYIEHEQRGNNNRGSSWGICGVGLSNDTKKRDILHDQDCLYTLIERSPEQDTARIIGSITRYLMAPENPQAVIDVLAGEECRIVTLTITEGGYFVIEGTGEFDAQHPTIQHDLQHPDRPKGVYGFLTAALKQRRDNNLPPFTVLSCDNVQGNGRVLGKMLIAFAKLQSPDLGAWIERNVAFPNSMVDRITPATTPDEIQMVEDKFGIEDAWPVVAEPFNQWVIEDKFCAGRPDWEAVGVQMTDDVHPYELAKLRLLNAGHSLLGFLGSLLGYTYTSEAMKYEPIRRAIKGLMDEVTPTLSPLPGVDIEEYKQTLIERFANPKVSDRLSRLCLNSSDKLPKFIFGSLRDKLKQDGSIDYLSFTIALWFRYLQGVDEQGKSLSIEDSRADLLVERARIAGSDPQPLLDLEEVFGDLAQSPHFVETVTKYQGEIDRLGTNVALLQFLEKTQKSLILEDK
ncbi:mannitol dehydrogenase family protein [Pleurocapsales cyanobacterium LEGE 10410]|nr:mannitol dehydrogenase family protein [Pleurocapsales cyanobacterium LEGE 10410]